MFNSHASSPKAAPRSLVFQQALAAAFKARRQNLPPPPASLPSLLDAVQDGASGLVAKPGSRDALGEIRARLFHAPGRDAEAQLWWHESLAAAAFAARAARALNASPGASFMGGLLHRAGESLALKILARVELDHRLTLDSASGREWCTSQGQELAERLVRGWNVPPQAASCALGWKRFGEFSTSTPDSAALYFGRLLALEMLQPQVCVPGALEHAAAELALTPEQVGEIRADEGCARELIRALD